MKRQEAIPCDTPQFCRVSDVTRQDLPNGWSQNWNKWRALDTSPEPPHTPQYETPKWHGSFRFIVGRLERVFHFLGQPELLMYKDGEDVDMLLETLDQLVFRAGGIFFSMDKQMNLYVIEGRHTFEEILESYHGQIRCRWRCPLATRLADPGLNYAALTTIEQFKDMFFGEISRRRNRWEEQRDRGGRPPPALIRGLDEVEMVDPTLPDDWPKTYQSGCESLSSDYDSD